MKKAKRFTIVWNTLLPAMLLSVTFGICGPIQMYLTNIGELWFSFGDILPICLLTGLAIFLVFAVIGAALPEKARNILGSILIGISLGLYIQGNFINTDYGVLDGRSIDWGAYTAVAVWNTLLWVACIALPLVICLVKPKLFQTGQPLVSICLAAVQILSVVILLATTNLSKTVEASGEKFLSTDGLDRVSKEGNVVIFVLDTFDQRFFDEIYQNSPDFLAPLSDFTYFDNCTCMYPTTKGSVPYMLTGKVYRNEVPYAEYLSEAFRETDYYRELRDQGYEIGLYTMPILIADDNDPSVLCNYVSSRPAVSSRMGLGRTLYKFTAFRYSPHILKPLFWFYGEEFDQWQKAASETGASVFSTGNIDYYNYLCNNGLVPMEFGKSYKLIHVDGPHPPYTIKENLTETGDGSATAITEAKASLNIVYTYLDKLKELELYDETLVVVTADHGMTTGEPTSPILLVKRPGATGFEINSAPVVNGDIMGTVMTELGLNKDGKYGRSVYDYHAGDQRDRRYYNYTSNINDISWQNNYLPPLTEFRVLPEGNSIDYFFPILNDAPAYALGTYLSFAQDATANPYAVLGISVSEKQFTWTSGTHAILGFHLDHTPQKDILAHFDIWNTFNDRQTVRAKVSEQLVCEEAVSGQGTLEFVIPHELVQADLLFIDLFLPDGISPNELSGSDDYRVLALALSGMVLEETEQAS